MFFRKRKKKPKKINPNVSKVYWIIAGFLALALIQNYNKTHSWLPAKSAAEIKQSIVQAAPKVPIDFSHIKNIFPVAPPVMDIKDIEEGKGETAVCGQHAAIAYTVATSDEKPISDSASKDNPLIFRIGEHSVMPALELGVVGMKIGGKRLIFAPAADAYDAKGFSRSDVEKDTKVVFNVELVDVTPHLPDAQDSAFRISNGQIGRGHPILCGQVAKVRIIVWDSQGKKLFPLSEEDAKPILFTPGKSEVFLGLEQGVIGMNAGGKSSLVVPPDFQKTMDGNSSKLQLPFPSKQIVLVDVEVAP